VAPFRVADPVKDIALFGRARDDVRRRRARGERLESGLFPIAVAKAAPSRNGKTRAAPPRKRGGV
jgi:hypothetical protein